MRPRLRSSANGTRRRCTASDCVEYTSSAPVKSATSASTSRFTRYARVSRAVDSSALRGVDTPTPGGSDAAIRSQRRRRVEAGLEAQVDARQRADATEGVLCAGDVHDAHDGAGVGGNAARHAQAHGVAAALHDEIVTRCDVQPRRRGGAQEHRVGPQQVDRLRRIADQRRRDGRRAQRVDAEDRQAALAARQRGVELQHGARDRHRLVAREACIDGFVEAGAAALHLQVRIAGQRGEARREFARVPCG